MLWGPLTLGGDCFHYHINDDDSPSAANPSTARRGQAEVRAIQLLKQNAAASGEGCSTCSSCLAMPQRVEDSTGSRLWFGGIKEEKENTGAVISFTVKSQGRAAAAGQIFTPYVKDGECFKPQPLYQPAMHQNRPCIWDALLLLVYLVEEAEHSSWLAGHTMVRPAQVLVVPDLTQSLTLIITKHPAGKTAIQSYPWPLSQGVVGLKPEGISVSCALLGDSNSVIPAQMRWEQQSQEQYTQQHHHSTQQFPALDIE